MRVLLPIGLFLPCILVAIICLLMLISSDSEFPALGGQPQNTNVQPWNRINTQSPSSQNRPPQPSDLFSDMDGYRLGGNGGGGGQGQGRQQMQPNSLDDFPALPRTAPNGDHLEDRGFMGMGAMGAAGQYGATRQANMGAAGRSGLGMGGGPPQSRLLDVMQQQPGGVQMSDVEKKVGDSTISWRVEIVQPYLAPWRNFMFPRSLC